MPTKKGDADTEQFSVTLPVSAVALLEQLVTIGLHGNSRAEVARTLILSRLEDLIAKNILAVTK